MAGSILNIADKTPKIEVDNRLSLRFYYRTAANLLRQASIYREEHNVIDLYILLVRFSSLVSETIPDHRDYRTICLRERAEYRKKLVDVLNELDGLKPEVRRQVERINRTRRLPPPPPPPIDDEWEDLAQWPSVPRSSNPHRLPSSSQGLDQWADPSSQWPSAPRALEQGRNREYSRNGSVNYREHQNYREQQAGDYWNSPSAVNTINSRLNGLSLNVPRPRDETLARHSIFAPTVARKQTSSFKAQYPNYVNASPIEMPSLEQSWNDLSQLHGGSNHLNAVPPSSEPVLWPDADTRHFPGGYSPVIGPDLAPVPSLITQPEPPPVPAPVQVLESPATLSNTQLPPDRVADPRPGCSQPFGEQFGQQKGPKQLTISIRMMEEFLALSKQNTQNNLETCAVLAGQLKKGRFFVSALIVPKQEATSDSCQTVNEEEIFDVQDSRNLFQLGWIHTHPTQTCFMSSIDLHTHYSYQIMLQEAIAIVMAPTDSQRKYGIFRLSDPGGVKSIQQCDQRGFHPHEEPADGSPIYEHCSHVLMSQDLRFEVIDLRRS